jgi:hypothetical protein
MDHDRLLYETAEKAVRLFYASKPKSASTRRAYYSDWRHFERWCQENGLDSLPAMPTSIVRYVDYLGRPRDGAKPNKPATISRRLCSINAAHKAAQLALDGSIAAVRNRALLLIGVAGALGNSELAGLTVGLPQHDGVTQTVEIPFATGDQPCAVKALKDWLKIVSLQEGKAFRSLAFSGAIRDGISPNSIGRLVQGMVRKAKISSPRSYGGHSVRIGNPSAYVGRSLLKQAAEVRKDIARRRPQLDQLDRLAAAASLGL